MQQERAPLWEILKKHVREEVISFHMPGHKASLNSEWACWLGKKALAIDLTEIPGTDDLHCPEGAIKEAQHLAAQAFGAEHSFFLINGTSCGIQAMIMTSCNPGEKIIVPRNVHRSILGGIILAGAVPIYLTPEVDKHWGIALGITKEQIEQALYLHNDAKAVLLVSPSYYGTVPDLKEIAHLVHRHNKLFLVDEAHGSHLAFHEKLPMTSLQAGADMCAQGVHKMLTGLTQASLLHVQGERVDLERLKNALRLVQSTSPSYLLMSSLDNARRQMALYGRELWEKALGLSDKARKKINLLAGFSCLGEEIIGKKGVYQLDLTKLAVNTSAIGLSGWDTEKILRYQYKIQPELTAFNHLLFLITPGNSEEEIDKLIWAFSEINHLSQQKKKREDGFSYWDIIPDSALSPREAYFAEKEVVSLDKVLNRISGETIAPYPPGIPVLTPGERIDENVLACLKEIQKNSLKIHGARDNTLHTLVVVK